MTGPPGKLYLVPNALDFGVSAEIPLQDTLPLGVMRTAARLTHWVAENAKTTRAFLKRVDAVVPLATPLQGLSIVEMPRPAKGSQRHAASLDWKPLLAPALQGHDIGLISEAGLPAVADPGAALVRAAHESNLEVVAMAGPSSLLLALAASGLNGQSFAFVGYLPVEANERAQHLRELEAHSRRHGQTQMMIETPYRNEALLAALLQHLREETLVSIGCGLTLAQAWVRTDPVGRWRQSNTRLPADVPAVFSLLAR